MNYPYNDLYLCVYMVDDDGYNLHLHSAHNIGQPVEDLDILPIIDETLTRALPKSSTYKGKIRQYGHYWENGRFVGVFDRFGFSVIGGDVVRHTNMEEITTYANLWDYKEYWLRA
jgi:hypothetical protein